MNPSRIKFAFKLVIIAAPPIAYPRFQHATWLFNQPIEYSKDLVHVRFSSPLYNEALGG